MKKAIVTCALSLMVSSLAAQSRDDIKLGIGASFLGTGDMLIGKLEGEATRKWNRIISNSVALGIGYGDQKFYYNPTYNYKSLHQQTFTTHLDGNVFVSPFGNDRLYNLKLGTGVSLMYVSDAFPRRNEAIQRENRASVGINMIMEHEFMLSKKSLIGLKMMIQPYLNGDIASTMLLKFGRKF